ncbi:MAG TPA: NHL repeat-containing protein [Solirubrobacterales bacterium]|nr:NHL repeat-containing protein [Solirubrobacterales bacterium]
MARSHRLRTLAATLATALAAIACVAAPAGAARLSGEVLAGWEPVGNSRVTLYASGISAPLGAARTDARGRFELDYARPQRSAVLYATAAGGRTPARAALRFLAVADPKDRAPRRLVLNEQTTVAAAYSLSRFLRGSRLAGPSPGLPNAAATVPNLVSPSTGRVSPVLAQPPNGRATQSLGTFRTLAAILAGCTSGGARECRALFRAAAPPRGPRPTDTLAAAHAIALHPAEGVRRIFRLPRSRAYPLQLRRPPSSWVLSLKHTDAAYDGPGNIAFDSRGNIWVTNNFEPPGTAAGSYVLALDPTGSPRLGEDGALSGGGILGNWWGVAVDQRDRVWLSNFTGNDPEEFNSPNFTGGRIVSQFSAAGRTPYPNGIVTGDLRAPQGIAVDQRGNVWVANHGGESVTLYPQGDPARARTIRGGGLYNPFTIAIDAEGNAWVDNGSLDSERAGSLTRISPSGEATGPFTVERMRSPQGMAIDSGGNLWVASLENDNVTWLGPDGQVRGRFRTPSIQGPWGVAVDGEDNVWVASFVGQKVTLLCGRIRANCPPGTRTGEPISPRRQGFSNGGLQHITAVKVDQSGNVWAANNWEKIKPTVGGDGLTQFIGAASPVKTPLIGPPQRP